MLNALAAHFIMEHNVPVLMAKPEEDNRESIKRLAGKAVGNIFHDPKIPFDKDDFNRARELLNPERNVMLLDIWQDMGWESLKEDIIAASNLGAKVVFIDPITNLTSGEDSGEANTMLEKISKSCSVLAKDLNIVIFLFCHLKSHNGNIGRDYREKQYRDGRYIGLGNCGHEYGGDIYSYQFAGSRAMMRSCNMMIGIEGNKDPEIPQDQRRVRHLKILEDRTFGASGVFPIIWNEHTSLYTET